MILAIGEGFWGKAEDEEDAFKNAKKHAPKGKRVTVDKLDFYYTDDNDATVDEVGNIVRKSGAKVMNIKPSCQQEF